MRLAAVAVPMVVVVVGSPPERRAARQLRRDERADGDGGDVAGAAERGNGEEHPAHAPSQARQVLGRDLGRDGRGPSDGPWLGHPASASSVGQVLGPAVGSDRDDRDVIGAGGERARRSGPRVIGPDPIATMASTSRSLPGISQSAAHEALQLPRCVVGRRAEVGLEVGARRIVGVVAARATGRVTARTGSGAGRRGIEARAHPRHALWRDEVREGAVRIGRGEVRHPLAQRRDEHGRSGAVGPGPR